jgi:hypothetical protein
MTTIRRTLNADRNVDASRRFAQRSTIARYARKNPRAVGRYIGVDGERLRALQKKYKHAWRTEFRHAVRLETDSDSRAFPAIAWPIE